MDLRTDDFDYDLPPELIAQRPAERRDRSRLLVLDRTDRALEHHRFADLPGLLRPGDLLVANRSRVIPARLRARKESGGEAELLLLRPLGPGYWQAMARPSRRLHPGGRLRFPGHELTATLERRTESGDWLVRFEAPSDVDEAIRVAGTIPLPPYIQAAGAPTDRYQTVYADRDGSVAAPTAGLHFTPELLKRLRAQGIEIAYVTLHVGAGTFRPVSAERAIDHHMHAEWGEVTEETIDAIERTRAAGGRVIAVGTTSTRLLETAARSGPIEPYRGETDLFILPGYRFRAIDGLITNFHLPRSTLLMLVSAFAGQDAIRDAYAEAVRERYRFYSFGDAMLIL